MDGSGYSAVGHYFRPGGPYPWLICPGLRAPRRMHGNGACAWKPERTENRQILRLPRIIAVPPNAR